MDFFVFFFDMILSILTAVFEVIVAFTFFVVAGSIFLICLVAYLIQKYRK